MPENAGFDSVLRKAVHELQKRDTEALFQAIENESPHVFSDTYIQKMRKLSASTEKVYFVLINTAAKRVAVLMITLLMALTVTTFSVDALREPLVDFFVRIYQSVSRIVFQVKEPIVLPERIERTYEPAYIPEGYALSDRQSYEHIFALIYKDADGTDLLYDQFVLRGTSLLLDTEGVVLEDIEGWDAKFFSNKGVNTLILTDGQYGFKLSGKIDKEELIRMAESIQ